MRNVEENSTLDEAAQAAEYVEAYFDFVENVPNEIQRILTRFRELDVAHTAKLEECKRWFAKVQESESPIRKEKFHIKMAQCLSIIQDIGDEKMAIIQILNETTDFRSKNVEKSFMRLSVAMEEPTQNEVKDIPVTPTSIVAGTISTSSNEKANKRSRRGGRGDNLSISETNQEIATGDVAIRNQTPVVAGTSQKKTGAGKKKKRKSKQNVQAQREDNSPRDEEPLIDPDEPTYCLCDQISYGEMIMCDNDLCPIEWFHFSCVSLTTKPKGKWYCPKCRGDRPNVMKPKAQFLRELEKYNKEKEEKT